MRNLNQHIFFSKLGRFFLVFEKDKGDPLPPYPKLRPTGAQGHSNGENILTDANFYLYHWLNISHRGLDRLYQSAPRVFLGALCTCNSCKNSASNANLQKIIIYLPHTKIA